MDPSGFSDELGEEESAPSSTAEDRIEFVKALDGTHAAEEWIRNYADGIGLEYQELMYAADDWIESRKDDGWGEYLNKGALLEGVSVSSEFWTKYEKVRGEKVEEDYKQNFFTCSC